MSKAPQFTLTQERHEHSISPDVARTELQCPVVISSTSAAVCCSVFLNLHEAQSPKHDLASQNVWSAPCRRALPLHTGIKARHAGRVKLVSSGRKALPDDVRRRGIKFLHNRTVVGSRIVNNSSIAEAFSPALTLRPPLRALFTAPRIASAVHSPICPSACPHLRWFAICANFLLAQT